MGKDVFLSYSRKDLRTAKRLVSVLEQCGRTVWWDLNIVIGRNPDDDIEEAIEAARCMVVIWSKYSVKSRWVRNEAAEGKKRGILLPVLIDDVKVPIRFRELQNSNLIGWEGSPTHPELTRLLGAVESHLGGSASG